MKWYRVVFYTGMKNHRKYYAIDLEAFDKDEAIEALFELWHDQSSAYAKHPQVRRIREDEDIMYYDFTPVDGEVC